MLQFSDLKNLLTGYQYSVGMRKEGKGIPEVFVRSVMTLYEGGGQREELWWIVRVHQGCVLSLFLFTVVVDAVTFFCKGD